MPQKMRIDGALRESEAQPRHKNIFDLFPDEDSIGFADFHGCDPDVAETRFRAFCVRVGLNVALGFSPASFLLSHPGGFACRRWALAQHPLCSLRLSGFERSAGL